MDASWIDEVAKSAPQTRILREPHQIRRFTTGIRFGQGSALVVFEPASLLDFWHVLKACIAADCIVICQAANTGITGGSTPDGDDYPGGLVIISTTRLSRLRVIRGGEQVVCLPGATLHELERTLRPYGREPHSVIGSSCFGASVVGGVGLSVALLMASLAPAVPA